MAGNGIYVTHMTTNENCSGRSAKSDGNFTAAVNAHSDNATIGGADEQYTGIRAWSKLRANLKNNKLMYIIERKTQFANARREADGETNLEQYCQYSEIEEPRPLFQIQAHVHEITI